MEELFTYLDSNGETIIWIVLIVIAIFYVLTGNKKRYEKTKE